MYWLKTGWQCINGDTTGHTSFALVREAIRRGVLPDTRLRRPFGYYFVNVYYGKEGKSRLYGGV